MLSSIATWLGREERQQRSVVRFYENFRSLCATNGLTLPRQKTARENASAAVDYFEEQLGSKKDRELPYRIASAFNSVRFGGDVLSEQAVAAVRDDVRRFGELLSGYSDKTIHSKAVAKLS